VAGALIASIRRRGWSAALVLATAASALTTSAAPLPSQGAGGPATPCAAIAAAEPQTGHTMPPPAPALFAADFPKLSDCEWGYQLGGFGGLHRGGPRRHLPVIFVHGNQGDTENWFLTADLFKKLAGYTNQELYAISYNGLGNVYAGLPARSQPAPESLAYWQANPTAVCCNGGHGASNEPNVLDLYNFIHAVQEYTGSGRVVIVAHSLGATIARETMRLHPELYQEVVAAVLIAGANHGTSICRGLQASYYGCDEIAPGTPWLTRLNAAGEAPGPTRWMSVYNGTDNTDPYFNTTPGVYDDRQSPHLDGATNLTFPATYHNDLRVDPTIVAAYLAFVLATEKPSLTGRGVATGSTPTGSELPNTSR
jgi:pimeloyl-ACP methyl ester carboxylesterase